MSRAQLILSYPDGETPGIRLLEGERVDQATRGLFSVTGAIHHQVDIFKHERGLADGFEFTL